MASIHWHSVFFLVFAGIACGCALAVVLSNHIVRMAFYLVLSLVGAAALFFLAGADFVGAAQIMIYVGATLVLLIFGVMLTAQGPFVSMKTRGGEWVLSLVAGGALFVILLQATLGVARWKAPSGEPLAAASPPTAARLGMGLLGARVDRLPGSEALSSPSNTVAPSPPSDTRGMAGYLLPFEIISIHLLVVLIGAAYLARPKRRARSEAEQEAQRGDRGMNLFTEPVGLAHYLVVGAILFVTGVVCMATKRNALGVLMGIELVLNGANVNFVAFGSETLRPHGAGLGLDGQWIALFVIVLAAAEAAVALAITLNFYNNHATVDVDQADELKG